MAGLPFDPLLAGVYSQFGKVVFARDAVTITLVGSDDGEYGLEAINASWRECCQERFALTLFQFAGEPGLAYHYMTVPSLADGQGRQPVVYADTYEQPYALPIASDVDRFFDLYARYLEALVASPGYEPSDATGLSFPWDVPRLLTEDTRLVELVRTGAFDSLMTQDEARAWAAKILQDAPRR